MSENEEKKSDLVRLFEIRNLIEKSTSKYGSDENVLTIGRIDNQLKDLNSKFDELRDIVITAKSRGDSPRKIKTKKDILALLKAYSRLNSEKLGKLVGLSRVRSNEYLKELENEGIVKSILVNKKKFYMLQDDLAGQ